MISIYRHLIFKFFNILFWTVFLIRIILFSNCWFVMKKLKINYLPMIYELNSKKIKPFKSLFSARKSEGFFKSSISGYLINDDEQFWEFHRLNHDQFNFTYFIFGPRRNNEETDITSTWVNIFRGKSITCLLWGKIWYFF